MADDIAALGIAFDSAPLKAGSEELRRFEAVAKRTGETVEQAQARFKALAAGRVVDLDAARRHTSATAAANAESARSVEINRRTAEQMLVMRNVMREFGNQANQMAGSLGRVGAVMIALGPGGLAAAAVIGTVALGLKQAADAALQLADRAGKLKDFSETTGFSVIQLQALEKAGAQVGVTSEAVARALERFSVQMVDVKNASGETFAKLLAVDPALALQVSRAESLSEAWDLVAVAIKKAGLEQGNQIARSFFGRGGVEITRLQRMNAEAGGIKGLIADLKAVDAITEEQAEHWDKLGDAIGENMKTARQNIVSTFAGQALTAMNEFTAGLKVLSRLVKESAPSTSETGEGWLSWANSWIDKFGRMLPLNALVIASIEKIRSLGLGEPTARVQVNALPTEDRAAEAAREKARQDAIRDFGLMKLRIEMLGGAATASEKLKLKTLELKAATAENSSLQKEANRNLADFKLEQSNAALGLRISLLGDMASVDEIVLQKQRAINDANKNGAGITKEETAAILQKTRILAENAKIESEMAFDRQQLFKSRTDQNIDSILRANGIPPESARAAAIRDYMRITDLIKEVRDAGTDFAKTFAQGMLDGKSGIDALTASLDQLARKLLDSGLNDLMQGLLTGNWVQAAIGVVKTAAAFITDAISDGAKKQQEERARQAKQVEVRDNAADVFGRLRGEAGGLAERIRSERRATLQLMVDAFEAQDWETYFAAQREFAQFMEREVGKFQQSWQGIVDAMASGMGMDSPFVKAGLQVREIADQIKQFVADTQEFVGGGVEEAKAAGRKQLLSMLDAPQDLSEVAARMLEIQGTANALGQALRELGASAEELAQIEVRRKRAVDDLRRSFEMDLERRKNELTGKSWLNDVLDAFKQRDKDLKDAATLGVDPSASNDIFALTIQKIIDDSKLTGAAFEELIRKFPELRGVIHEFVEDLRRSEEELAASRQSLEDRRFAATVDTSTLEGALADLARRHQRERLEEEKAGGDLLLDLLLTQFIEREQLTKTFNDRALAETKRSEEERLAALNQAARGIVDYLTDLNTGSQSTLSPQAKFNAAQQTYASQLALAQGGNVAAQAGITKFAEAFRAAGREIFASSAAYQQIEAQIRADLLALPAVQTSTDPIVQAMVNVLTAINSGNASQAKDATLSGIILTALNSGNAAAIATALDANFDAVQTAAAGGITLFGMQTALAGDYHVGTLKGIFETLDLNKNNVLEKSELEAQRQDIGKIAFPPSSHPIFTVGTNTGNTKNSVDSVATAVGAVQTAVNAVSGAVGTVNSSIGALNTNQGELHEMLQTQTGSIIELSGFVRSNVQSVAQQSGALDDITYNTRWNWDTDDNVWRFNPSGIDGGQGSGFALGGTLAPYMTGIMGEHHRDGPFIVRAGSQPIPISPHMPSFAANDNGNGALLAKIDRLTAELAALKMTVAVSGMNVAQAVRESGDEIVGSVETSGKKTTETLRMDKRDNRLKAAS